jgi:hypothetical protein
MILIDVKQNVLGPAYQEQAAFPSTLTTLIAAVSSCFFKEPELLDTGDFESVEELVDSQDEESSIERDPSCFDAILVCGFGMVKCFKDAGAHARKAHEQFSSWIEDPFSSSLAAENELYHQMEIVMVNDGDPQ